MAIGLCDVVVWGKRLVFHECRSRFEKTYLGAKPRAGWWRSCFVEMNGGDRINVGVGL